MSFRSTRPPDDGSTALRADASPVLRSSSARFLRASSVENDANSHLPSNGHLHIKNHRPSFHQHSDSFNSMATSASLQHNAAASNQSSSSSFFIMVTGNIESATTFSKNEQLYCRYTFSYGSDWEVVHGVSHGLSQIGRQGIVKSSECGNDVIVWNFPIEISFQSTNPHGWPRLALSVYGFDFLGRDVLRGYASVLLPINPGRHTKHVKTFRPVSGGKCQQVLNWITGTTPEYYDSKTVTRGEGRGVTRVVSEDGMAIKVNLLVTRKDFNSFGYSSQPVRSQE